MLHENKTKLVTVYYCIVYTKKVTDPQFAHFWDGAMKLKMPSEIQLLSQFTMHILTKLSFKIKNITQKVPPILVVKVAFRRGVLPTNETETYPPKNTMGTRHLWDHNFAVRCLRIHEVFPALIKVSWFRNAFLEELKIPKRYFKLTDL